MKATDFRLPPAEELQRLDRQLCFPLYAASRLVTRLYQPMLDPLGLTYPQYIVLMILWEDAPCPVSHIGKRALLNTNTLTPLLKRLEQLGYVQRQRSKADERIVEISLTDTGSALKQQCACIPAELVQTLGMPLEKLATLKVLVDELVGHLQQAEDSLGD